MAQDNQWTLTISQNAMLAALSVNHEAVVEAGHILDALTKAGICYGIRETAIEQALAQRNKPLTVAKGTPMIPGIADSLTFHVPESLLSEEIAFTIREDMHRSSEIPSVKAGDKLVTRIPGNPGVAGKDIFGKLLKPPALPQIQLRAMNGTVLSEDGHTVLAAISGRPHLRQERNVFRLQVMPTFIHRGDLTIEAGHLSFQGDITITGCVLENVSVLASGSVDILGNVIEARINAAQTLLIRGNAIACHLSAGATLPVLTEICPIVTEIILELASFSAVLEQLDNRGQLSALPFPTIAAQLLSIKFPRYGELHQQLSELLRGHERTAEKNTALTEALILAESLQPQSWADRQHLQDAVSRALEMRNKLDKAAKQRGDIFLSYALNSNLSATGKIVIRGQGCIHSNLAAGQGVQIQGRLRGGTVRGETIYVREAGSEAGAVTTLQVSSKGWIDVDKAFENTIFIVGKSILKIGGTVGRSRFAIGEEGHTVMFSRH
ncbi:MAG: DUF342 domain-containing protein [Dethiobacter sp.]|jgi:cytoskeletal protein CcmA (bactofilin family)|nr:DUF342 domain-containing protein [Dethiobacter sp.]MBS3902203.1 DUF342 domain-containing protein [Dethiobacter sp.]MBS3988624.1 DUF342 domain-containing protein [Dethiobacter sp.]